MQLNNLNPEDQQPSLSDYVSREKLQEKYSDLFTLTQLDWILRNRTRNGLSESGAVVMISRKPYFHVPAFTAWFASKKA